MVASLFFSGGGIFFFWGGDGGGGGYGVWDLGFRAWGFGLSSF